MAAVPAIVAIGSAAYEAYQSSQPAPPKVTAIPKAQPLPARQDILFPTSNTSSSLPTQALPYQNPVQSTDSTVSPTGNQNLSQLLTALNGGNTGGI